jgi:hypothetical protein
LKGLGLGVYDIHSPRVPSTEEMYKLSLMRLNVCPTDRFWVNPDCGLKTRQQEETVAALKNMVEAAKQARAISLFPPANQRFNTPFEPSFSCSFLQRENSKNMRHRSGAIRNGT